MTNTVEPKYRVWYGLETEDVGELYKRFYVEAFSVEHAKHILNILLDYSEFLCEEELMDVDSDINTFVGGLEVSVDNIWEEWKDDNGNDIWYEEKI